MFDVGDFIFSSDLKSAYHHIEIFEELHHISASQCLKVKYDIWYSLYYLLVFLSLVIFFRRFSERLSNISDPKTK